LNINVLVIAVIYQGLSFPLMFKLLPKAGNSNTNERIELIERFIRLFGTQALDCLTADREFVGEKWTKYLNDQNIRYYIRIRENFWVLQPHNGKRVRASWLFANLPLNSCRVNDRIVYVNNQLCYLSGSKVKNKAGKFLVASLAFRIWQTSEPFFSDMSNSRSMTSGFSERLNSIPFSADNAGINRAPGNASVSMVFKRNRLSALSSIANIFTFSISIIILDRSIFCSCGTHLHFRSFDV